MDSRSFAGSTDRDNDQPTKLDQPFNDFPGYLTISEAAESLHCSLDYVRAFALIFGLPIQVAEESEDSNEVV